MLRIYARFRVLQKKSRGAKSRRLIAAVFVFLSRSELDVNKNIDSSIVIKDRSLSTILLKGCQKLTLMTS